MKFKKGDIVIKYRPWSPERYCKFGGDESFVPIGSRGEVISPEVTGSEDFKVRFFNAATKQHHTWSVHFSEIRHGNTLKSLLEDE